MSFLKPLLSFLVLPPVNLVLVILTGWVVLRRRPRLGRWLVGVGSLLLLVLAMPVVAGVLLASLEQGLPTTPPPDQPPGAIVILGAEVAHTAGEPPGAEVGPLTLERLRAGAALHRKTGLPILVTGGVTGQKLPPVGKLMAQSLERDFQVPVRWSEIRSSDTWENAQDSAAILRTAGISSVYVVTHAWHERRAMMAFARAGLTATVAPIRFDPYPTPVPDDFRPRVSGWQVSFYALHEWIGCAWYALR